MDIIIQESPSFNSVIMIYKKLYFKSTKFELFVINFDRLILSDKLIMKQQTTGHSKKLLKSVVLFTIWLRIHWHGVSLFTGKHGVFDACERLKRLSDLVIDEMPMAD